MLREVSFYSVCMPERAGLGFQSSGRSFLAGRILLVCTKGAYTGRIFSASSAWLCVPYLFRHGQAHVIQKYPSNGTA